MSNSDRVPESPRLDEKVLLVVAKRLGPLIDRIEITTMAQVEVREVLEEVCKAHVSSPAMARVALLRGIERGWFAEAPGPRTSFDLCEPEAAIRLRPAGLIAARRVDPEVGCRLGPIRVTLQEPDEWTPLRLRFTTGRPEADKKLNRSHVSLSAFLLLMGFEPTKERPLRVPSEMTTYSLENLARRGIFPARGPGERITPSEESLRDALNQWVQLLPQVESGKDPLDGRVSVWWLDGGPPEVEFEAHPSAFTQEWSDYKHAVWSILQRDWNPFVKGDQADPDRTCPEGS